MKLSYINDEGFSQQVDFDEDKFFEFILREKKYKKAGRGKHVHEILNKCIRAAANTHNIYGTKLDRLIRIELLDI